MREREQGEESRGVDENAAREGAGPRTYTVAEETGMVTFDLGGKQKLKDTTYKIPPPWIDFQAQVLHGRNCAGAEKGGGEKISSTTFRTRIFWCWHPLRCGVVEVSKSIQRLWLAFATYGV